MPVMDGLEATLDLAGRVGDPIPVLVLTTFDLDEYVYEALRAGASGYLLKDAHRIGSSPRSTVARGDALIAPSATRRLINRFVARTPAPPLRNSVSSRAGKSTCFSASPAGAPTPNSPAT